MHEIDTNQNVFTVFKVYHFVTCELHHVTILLTIEPILYEVYYTMINFYIDFPFLYTLKVIMKL